MAIALLLPSLKASCTEGQPSVLLAVPFPGETPEKAQPVGSAAMEGPFLGQPRTGWVRGVWPCSPQSPFGVFSSHSLSAVSLRAEVAKVEGKWIYCPHGPRAAHHRSVAGLPWGFDWSVQGDAL